MGAMTVRNRTAASRVEEHAAADHAAHEHVLAELRLYAGELGRDPRRARRVDVAAHARPASPAADERAMLKQLWSEWWAGMEALELEAEALGLRWCRWGGYDLAGIRCNEASDEKPGIACSSCAWRDQLEMVAA